MTITKKPHLPEGKCKLIIADKRMFTQGYEDFEVIQTKDSSLFLEGIRSHPDMQICHLKNKDIAVCDEFYNYYNKKLSQYGFNIIKGRNPISEAYPKDIAFNCVILGDTLYHKLSHTDEAIMCYAKENGMRTVNVKQGYTKCSTYIIDEKSVITSDRGLYNIYRDDGIDVLYVDSSNIHLPGFDCGFIGGCGGRISDNELYFSGDITELPEYTSIMRFVSEKNYKVIYPKNKKLTDYGSIIPLVHI